MIVQRRVSWLRLVFALRGSVAMRIWRRFTFTVVVAVGVTYLNRQDLLHESITSVPFALVGLALSIFLGFRNNTSYDRFWEGRKLWGALVNTARSITRQIITLVVVDSSRESPKITDLHRELVYRVAAYVHALRMHLRGEKDLSELTAFLDEAEVRRLERETNPPIAMLQALGDRFYAAWRREQVHTYHLPVLEGSLTALADIQGGCERIRATPIPFAYTVLMHRIVAFYCLGLPFGIVQDVGILTPLVVGMVSYAFFALDAIGEEIENPFEKDPNDLPLSQLSRMIEINLRERLGETDLPEPERPVRGVLS